MNHIWLQPAAKPGNPPPSAKCCPSVSSWNHQNFEDILFAFHIYAAPQARFCRPLELHVHLYFCPSAVAKFGVGKLFWGLKSNFNLLIFTRFAKIPPPNGPPRRTAGVAGQAGVVLILSCGMWIIRTTTSNTATVRCVPII
jgi:hypothetical protein